MDEQQQWRRERRRPAASTAPQAGPMAPIRTRTAAPTSSRPTTALRLSGDASLARPRGGNNGKDGVTAAPDTSTAPQAPPSRWRELRQSVRIKATRDTEEAQPNTARIADLCAEDREKVAKLVRRLVEVGSKHEESKKNLESQRSESENQLGELRTQSKRDAQELEELRGLLRSARRKVKRLEKRVLKLEASADAETRQRLDAEQALEQLKLQTSQLQALFHDQREEMQREAQQQQRESEAELKRVGEQLREAQELLLKERQDRVQEKQQELQQRLERSTAASVVEKAQDAAEKAVVQRLDVSSFLNTSCELPEKMQEILDSWKQRVEDALAGATAPGEISQIQPDKTETATAKEAKAETSSVACQTADNEVQEHTQSVRKEDDFEPQKSVNAARKELGSAVKDAPDSVEDSKTRPEVEEGFVTPVGSRQRRHLRQQRVPKVKRLDFDQFISALGSDSDGSEPTDEIGLQAEDLPKVRGSFESDSSLPNTTDDAQQSEKRAKLAASRASNDSFGDLYETSLFDVVEAVERTHQPSRTMNGFQFEEKAPRFSERLDQSAKGLGRIESPSTRVEGLRKQMEARERALYGPNGVVRREKQEVKPSGGQDVQNQPLGADWDDIAVFEEVKELYSEDVFASRRWGTSASVGRPVDASIASLFRGEEQRDAARVAMDIDASSPTPLSAQEISVREAIERDMKELLRSENLQYLSAEQQQ